jgi:hypothetical protein
MAEKTAWARVLDEPVIHAPGERAMKVQMDARFDGSFKQFVEWVTETFKNPDDLRVRVIVGTFPLRDEVVPEPEPEYSAEAIRLRNITGTKLSLAEADALVRSIQRIASTQNKINAMKTLRDATNLALREAKEFVEALPPFKDEIPF